MPNKWDIHQQAKHENANQEKELVIENRTITTHEVVNILGISQEGVSSEHYEKENLNMHHISRKQVSLS